MRTIWDLNEQEWNQWSGFGPLLHHTTHISVLYCFYSAMLVFFLHDYYRRLFKNHSQALQVIMFSVCEWSLIALWVELALSICTLCTKDQEPACTSCQSLCQCLQLREKREKNHESELWEKQSGKHVVRRACETNPCLSNFCELSPDSVLAHWASSSVPLIFK